MTVAEHFRTVSGNNVFVASDRAVAVYNLLSASPGSQGNATIINQVNVWPKLDSYLNDNTLPGAPFTPSYIWDSTVSDGLSRGFAVECMRLGISSSIQIISNVSVFTDNAHEAVIEVYDVEGPTPVLVGPISPVPLVDGNMDPVTGIFEIQPYNWQTVRCFSTSSGILPASSYSVILSFRVVNYNVFPPFSNNPAGLSFIADTYIVTV